MLFFELSIHPDKIYHSFHKNIKQHNYSIFNIDNNNKYFLSSKSAYKNDF